MELEAGVVELMVNVIKLAKHSYTCNRPPGAAGAFLSTPHGSIFAGVEPPPKSPTCKEVGCDIIYETDDISKHGEDVTGKFHAHCVRTIHAEQRAIAIAAKNGIATNGAEMFSVLKPCYACTKLIIVASIQKIYYAGKAYDDERTRKILEAAGVECIFVDVGLEYGK